MNACAVRTSAQCSSEEFGLGYWLKNGPMPHESDGRVFWVFEDVQYFDDAVGRERTIRSRVSQFRCLHCGSMFMEAQ